MCPLKSLQLAQTIRFLLVIVTIGQTMCILVEIVVIGLD